MKILVPVKRVVDYNVKIRVKSDGTGVELANVKMSMNPFDEIAVEEAVRLKEAGMATEVIVVSVGPRRHAGDAAHGAGDGRRPRHPDQGRRDRRAARGRQAAEGVVDGSSPASSSWASRRSTTIATRPARCSPRCTGWAQATFASKVVVGDGAVDVTREVDGGLQTVSLKLPAIVTTDLRLNEPRYATLPNIMKAKKKPMDEKTPADLGVDVSPRLKVLKTAEPGGRKAGVKVKTWRSWSRSCATKRK